MQSHRHEAPALEHETFMHSETRSSLTLKQKRKENCANKKEMNFKSTSSFCSPPIFVTHKMPKLILAGNKRTAELCKVFRKKCLDASKYQCNQEAKLNKKNENFVASAQCKGTLEEWTNPTLYFQFF